MKIHLRYALPLILFLILVSISGIALYATIKGKRDPQAIPSVLINKPAPEEGIKKLTNPSESLFIADYRGEAILVNFFASWCVPCRAEMPILSKLSSDITIIGIAYKDKDKDSKKFLKQYGNPYSAIGFDPDGRFGLSWGVYGIPETYLLDAHSRVLWRHAGVIDKTVIEQTLRPLLDAL